MVVMYEPRFYREQLDGDDLCLFEVVDNETDLLIAADTDLSKLASGFVREARCFIEEYIQTNPIFLKSFVPVEIPLSAPDIIKMMGNAAKVAGVGPMAAVAGAISEYVGNRLLDYSKEIIIENGGDVFIKTNKERKIGIFAGKSVLSNKLAVAISPEATPLGICTSSGTVGHSVSFGKAEAVVIMSRDTALADAVATRIGNLVRSKKDIENAVAQSRQIPGIEGTIIVIEDSLGSWGKFELCPI